MNELAFHLAVPNRAVRVNRASKSTAGLTYWSWHAMSTKKGYEVSSNTRYAPVIYRPYERTWHSIRSTTLAGNFAGEPYGEPY